jgi:hypothetical protein
MKEGWKMVTKDLSPRRKICSHFFFLVPGFELRAYTLSHSTSPFGVRHFRDSLS